MESFKGKFSDISRPLNESFRHTGHGSVLGQSWGNPTFLDPAFLGDVELRGSAVAPKDIRKKKCVSEQYVRERKSNAVKQFAYNKLKNENKMSQQQQLRLQPKSSKLTTSAAPKRPPQPNFDGTSKEGVLIDISPPSELPASSVSHQRINMNMSILDAPIDIPTEGESSISNDLPGETSKMEPPPYQSPPTYMNTYGLAQASNSMSASTKDPFDTSHIASHKPYSPLPMPKSIPSPSTNGVTMMRQRPPKSQLDDLVQSTMASLSPKGSYTSLNNIELNGKVSSCGNLSQWRTTNTDHFDVSNDSVRSPSALANSSNDALSDSLNVNLSSSTMQDTETDHSRTAGDLINSFGHTEPTTKIDKAFLAELEKEIYKNDSAMANLNVNMSGSHNSQYQHEKEYSVTTIPNEIYANRVHTETQSPARLTHSQVKAINEEIAYVKSNYEAVSSAGGRKYYSPTATKKQYNTDTKPIDMSATAAILSSTANQSNASFHASSAMSTERPMSMTEINEAVRSQAIYSNFALSNVYSNAAAEQKHNFVAVSNWPTPSTNNLTRSNYSVTSDIYGSLAGGNVYDVVAAPQSSDSSAYYGVVVPTTADVHRKPADYYETASNIDPQTVIYDEVADEDLRRPHRPAPIAPPVLSAQQIQRRIERAHKEQQMYGNIGGAGQSNNFDSIDTIGSQQQKIMTLISEVAGDGGDASEHEARQALIAANWDHASAARNFKIERLLR